MATRDIPAPPKGSNGWSKSELYVMSMLAEIRQDVRQLRIDMAKQQVKSGVWGVIGGLVPASAAVLYMVLK